MNRIIVIIHCTVLFGATSLLAKDGPANVKNSVSTAKAKPAAATEAEPPVAKAEPQVVEISVTKAGFVPAEIRVKAGQPVKLMVTRKIEKTCAKDIVIKDYNINKPLPLNQTVEVQFTPSKPGNTRFACAMNMIAGVVVAE